MFGKYRKVPQNRTMQKHCIITLYCVTLHVLVLTHSHSKLQPYCTITFNSYSSPSPHLECIANALSPGRRLQQST